MSDLFEPKFYAAKYGLPRWLPSPLIKAHYRLLGSRRGYEPVPFFDPAFFARQADRRGLPPVSPRRAWSTYLSNPAYWSVDPHPAAFFPHETFASCSPTANPLATASEPRATEVQFGYGHPLLDIRWWVEQHGLPGDSSLDAVLRNVTAEAAAAAADHRVVALSPPLDVLFINGEDYCPACTQYRVWSPAQALRNAGLRVAIVDAQDIVDDRFRGIRIDARAVIVFRARVDGQLLGVVDALRARGATIGFDCDDLIFDRPHTVGLQPDEFGHRDITSVNRHSRGMQPLLQRADFAVVPTETIARAVADNGVPIERIWVCPSFLSHAQLAAAPAPTSARPTRTLSIASGTWTHQEDFRPLAGPLASVLSRNPDVTLKVFGALNVDQFPELLAVESQIDRDTRVIRDWGQYVARYQESAMNLVSMDYDNGFCHGKSEVKYIEAGLAGTATMATRTEAFRRALRGPSAIWLTGTPQEWTAALDAFAAAPSAADEAGEHAHADVIARYGPDGKFAAQYVAAVHAALGDAARATPLIESRWTSDDASDDAGRFPQRLHDAARTVGCARITMARSPRELDIWVTTGEASGPETSLPWVDPAIYFERSTAPDLQCPSAVVLLVPEGAAIDEDIAARVREWRNAAAMAGATVTVVGRTAEEVGVPRGDYWVPGGSEVELATLLRRADVAVQVQPGNPDSAVAGALMVGTPLAMTSEGTTGDGIVPDGWRVISITPGTTA